LETFDSKRCVDGKEVHFVTYASYWIEHAIRRTIQNVGRTVAMPVSVQEMWANRSSQAILLIRILVGWIFLSDSLGVGRFAKIGIPWPHVMAPFVGVVEVVCGSGS